MKTLPVSSISFFICVFIFFAHPVYAAKHAAKVIYAFGDVTAAAKSGARKLAKGDLVFSGETVSTARGRAQIKFTDGGFASLQPNTDYEIDEYNFEGKADGKERSFLNLLKGSVRLVTGVIGKANRRNFRIKTAVATIGIRGTQGTIVHNPTTNKTLLKGYGGEWDLVSGSFSGGVKPGQAYSCDGVSCSSIAGVNQRSDVEPIFNFAEVEESVYQQGQQVDADGVICGLGGDCGELAVTIDQVGAVAGSIDDGEVITGATDFIEGLGVVTVGEKPVALVGDGTTDGGASAAIVATDVEAIRTALNQFAGETDSDIVDQGNQFLDSLDPTLLAELEANPATVADEDFGSSPDGLVNFGRWVDGNILIASTDFGPGGTFQRLDALEGFESFHFIYGTELRELSFTGIGVYSLNGGTFPTAVNGSTIGSIPTIGSLSWNFGTGDGTVAIIIPDFDGISFNIGGTIGLPDAGDLNDPGLPKVFTENNVVATFFAGGIPMSAPVTLDGFFTGENGSGAPLAAGLAYEVDYYSNPFVGTASFGLAGATVPTTSTTIKYAVNYLDGTGMAPFAVANGDDSLPNGTPISSFSTAFGDTFNQAAASVIEGGAEPSSGAHYRRFSSGFTFSSLALPAGATTQTFHAVKTDFTTPNEAITSQTGTTVYNLYAGTVPTILYDSSGGSFSFTETGGILANATFTANFTTGTMDSVAINGSFPTLSSSAFSLLSSGPVPINSGFANMTGILSDSGGPISCFTGCPFAAAIVNYAFTSDNAGGPPTGVISSYHAFGSSGSSPFSIVGTAISR